HFFLATERVERFQRDCAVLLEYIVPSREGRLYIQQMLEKFLSNPFLHSHQKAVSTILQNIVIVVHNEQEFPLFFLCYIKYVVELHIDKQDFYRRRAPENRPYLAVHLSSLHRYRYHRQQSVTAQ